MAAPRMPMVAALSAAHLAAILFPATLRRLYIVRDDDPSGDGARDSLVARANAAGIEAIVLSPTLGDFNEDLRLIGIVALWANVRVPEGCDNSPALSARPRWRLPIRLDEARQGRALQAQ